MIINNIKIIKRELKQHFKIIQNLMDDLDYNLNELKDNQNSNEARMLINIAQDKLKNITKKYRDDK